MDSYLMRGLVPERVYPSVEQSQSPCAEGQTATILEAVVAVLDVSWVVVLATCVKRVWEGDIPRLQHLPNHGDVRVRKRARPLACTCDCEL